MWDPRAPEPQGSFQSPVPIPASGPGDSPLMCLAINADWMPYVLGCLKQLMLPATWGDMRDPAVQAAQAAANDLIALFSEATECGAGDVAGTYAEDCLTTNFTILSNTVNTVLTLNVQPGQYELVAQGSVDWTGGALHFTMTIRQGDTVLSETETTSGNVQWKQTFSISAKVEPTEATDYTLCIVPAGADATAQADPQENGSGAHVTTCLRAYPLGISGPVGADGPPGPPYMLRFNDSCGFEYSIDGGDTWNPVPGWADNAPSCFPGFHGGTIPIGLIDPGEPPTLGDDVPSQRACNIAAYLANVVLQGALNEAQRQANLTHTALDFGVALLALIPGIDIAELGFIEGANILYQLVDGANLSDFTSAASDETLWAAVTCAIYGCISADGEVNAANFDCVGAALGAISYTHSEVPTALALFWGGLGLQAVRAAQIAGALESADCTSCGGFGPWCTWWEADQRDMCNGEWVGITGGDTATPSACGGGSFASVNNGAGGEFVVVRADLPSPRTITTVRVDYTAGALDVFNIRFYNAAGTVIATSHSTNWKAADSLGPQAGVVAIEVEKGSGNSAFSLGSIKVGGPDSGSPWGENNGVCD